MTTASDFPRPSSIDAPKPRRVNWATVDSSIEDAAAAFADAYSDLLEVVSGLPRSSSNSYTQPEGLVAEAMALRDSIDAFRRHAQRVSGNHICEECGESVAFGELKPVNLPTTYRGRASFISRSLCSSCAYDADSARGV